MGGPTFTYPICPALTHSEMVLLVAVYFMLVAAAATTTAADVPPIPTDFHAVVNSTAEGLFCAYWQFSEVYQDVTNNRALLVGSHVVAEQSRSNYLLVVAPEGAAPGTKETTEMTLFEIKMDGSCSYSVNDWPCRDPSLNIQQCATPFGYPKFDTVGPWQMPDHVPKEYVGKVVIEVGGRNVTADKWTEQSGHLQPLDTVSYWVDASNNKIPLRFQHIHPHTNGFFPGDSWSYQLDYLKITFGSAPDSVFAPPDNWVEKCVDGNAGLITVNLPGRQDGYVYSQPNRPGNFSLALRTRPASKLPVIINITFCNSSDPNQNCVDDETCNTCAEVIPTKMEFTQENWKQPQMVTVVFRHIGVGQYKFGVSDNYPVFNQLNSMQFSAFACNPVDKVPCTLPPQMWK